MLIKPKTRAPGQSCFRGGPRAKTPERRSPTRRGHFRFQRAGSESGAPPHGALGGLVIRSGCARRLIAATQAFIPTIFADVDFQFLNALNSWVNPGEQKFERETQAKNPHDSAPMILPFPPEIA